MVVLARGLYTSGHPFVWAIRPPFGSFSDVSAAALTYVVLWDLTHWLPTWGF